MPSGVVNVQVNAIGNFSNIIGEVGKLQSKLQGLKLPKGLGDEAAKGLTDLEQKFSNLQNLANRGIKTKADFNNFEKATKEVDTALKQVEKSINSINDKKIKLNLTDNNEIKKKIQELEQFKKEATLVNNLKSFNTKEAVGIFNTATVEKIKNSFGEASKGAKYFQDVINGFKTGNIEKASSALEKFFSYTKQYETVLNQSGQNTRGTDAFEWAKKAKAAIGDADTKIKEFNADIKQMRADQFTKVSSGVERLKSQLTGMSSSIHQSTQEMRNMAVASRDMQSQLGTLQTQANYFFGLQNMFQLFKRNIQDTFDTVKQLDAAMTETAVVTDYSVADMWSELPLYTKTANKLGATIKGAYETMTLYYQQGLNTEEAFAVGTETMKMARIAGLDYADTTNMMTAALRGFNMEINTTSAKRINDVYSELAAITASDTRELGLAMERTASIAHSANMDFGNTTAFLAQMIETTREAPENLGTAMKTIIARFQELKENPYQISEVEGEEVDFNRVDKALKSIGVDLMDNRDKFRDLDDVFMDISERWDGLSQTQQRYIATIAAGARQQSRFLAMVSNYDRLKQLTDAAANSEGASDVQFAKTLDSMEAKLNRLRNAWDQFAMGIANNKVLKGAVDAGVSALTLVNKIEDKVQNLAGGFDTWTGSIAKSITSLTALWAAFKIGGKIVDTSIGVLGGFLGVTKTKGAGLLSGISGQRSAANAAQASAIYSPIVNAINNAAARITNSEQSLWQKTKTDTSNSFNRQDFRNAQRNLKFDQKENRLNSSGNIKTVRTSKKFSSLDVTNELKNFDAEQQRILLKQVPGTRAALERSYQEATKKLNLSQSATNTVAQLRSQISQEMMRPGGSISPEAGLNLLGNPKQLARYIDNDQVRKELLNGVKANRQKILEEAKAKGIGKDRTGAGRYKAIADYMRSQEQQLYNPTTKLTGKELKANTFSGITAGATAAGQAVMNLGMALDGLGLHGAGSALTSIGGTMTSLGLAAAGAVEGVSALNKVLATVGLSAGPVGLAMAGIAAVITAAAVVANKEKKAIQKIQKDGKKVVEDYDNTIEKTIKNINNLTDEASTFATLSLGVDANNNNVSLGTEEYSDYLKIVNDVAKMHPELVKGYNAHGQAILKNNKAVEEAIQLEKEEQKQAEKTFASTNSLDKLIASRNTTKRWKVDQGRLKANMSGHGGVVMAKQNVGDEARRKVSSKLGQDTQKVISNIQQLKDGDKILTDFANQYGVKISDLTNLTDIGIRAIQDHGEALLDTVQTQYGNASSETTKALVENVQNSIAQVGKDTQGIEEVTEPIYRSLSTYASQHKLFDNIPDELREAAEAGLKEISKLSIDPETGKDITGTAMQQRAETLAKKIENLNGHSEEYKRILDDVTKKQEEFSISADKDTYLEATNESINQLQLWANQARILYNDLGDETQLALAETFENQIATIQSFVNEGAAILSEGFNSMADKIEVANNAHESFQKQVEGGDYYTGADNMKQIFDDIKDGVDDAGRGSQTFWKGARELLGDKFVENNSFDKVNKQLEKFKNLFYDANNEVLDGEVATENFFDYLQSKQDALLPENLFPKGKDGKPQTIADFFKVTDEDLDFNLNDLSDDQFRALADSLGMSDQMLASMLNKAKQFYDIDFSNIDVLRSALAADAMPSVVGEGVTGENQNLYVKQSTFDAEASAEEYSEDEIKKFHKTASKNGIKLIPEADALTSLKPDDFTKTMGGYIDDMGIKTTQGFVDTFSKLGFNKEDLQSLYEKGVETGLLEEGKYKGEDAFDQYYADTLEKQQESIANTAEEKTADNTSRIASTTEGILSALGVNEGFGAEAKDWVLGGKGQDTEAQYFATGKDKNGNLFKTDEDFKKVDQELTDKINQWETQKAGIKAGISNTRGAERKELQEELQNLDYAINKTKEYQEAGRRAYEERKTQTQTETSSDNSLEKQQIEQLNESYKNLGLTKQQIEEGGFNDFVPNEEQLANLDSMGNKIQVLKEDSILTKDDLKQLSIAFSQLSPEELANLDQQGFSNIIKDLDLTAEKAQALNEIAPKLSIEVDTSKAETAWDKIKKVFSGGDTQTQPEQSKSDGQSQNLTVDNNITLNSKIINPDEPEQKIDDAMPKDYTKTVSASISLDPEVKIGKLNKKNSSEVKDATKGLKAETSITVTAKVKGKNDVDSLKTSIENVQGKSVKVSANVWGISSVNSLASAISSLQDKSISITTHKKTVNDEKGGFITNTGVAYRAKGGTLFKKKGTDTVPAMLTPGEYVQKRSAVQYFGVGFMREVNRLNPRGALDELLKKNSINIGSAATGSQYGKIGPRGRGGLTLTGEEGFEIAWLPSENRSMILGANGPQMINLPANAVVWTNEESKKILSQRGIPAGSHRGKNVHYTGKRHKVPNSGGSSGGSTSNSNSKSNNSNNKDTKKNNKETKKIIQKAGKINAWWWNMTKKVEATQRKIDKLSKQTEKLLKQIGSTLSSVGGTVNKYIGQLKKQISLNTTMKNKAEKKLTTLDTAKATKATKKAQKKVDKAQKKVDKAKKTKSKKDDKQAKKELKKAKKQLKKTQKGVNYSTVSYEVTQVKKKKGKTKKTKKTKKSRINLAPYIYYDTATGAYQVDYKKINKKFGKNKSKAKGVMEAAEKKIDDYTNKRNTAEDNIEKANEALEQLGQELYETFHGWEISLTKIWNITQRIEESSSRIERLTSFMDLLDAQLSSGLANPSTDFIKNYTETFNKKAAASVQKVEQQMQSIELNKLDLQDLYNTNANVGLVNNLQSQINSSLQWEKDLETAQSVYNSNRKAKANYQAQVTDAEAKAKTAKQKYGKNSKQYKAAQQVVTDAKAELARVQSITQSSQTRLTTLQTQFDAGVKAGTLYDETGRLDAETYIKNLKDERDVRVKARDFTKFKTNADGTISIDFNTDAFRAARESSGEDGIDAEMASKIQDYVQSLVDKTNELNSAYAEATNLIAEQYQSLAELKQQWSDYGEQLLSYYEDQQSQKIDELKSLSEAINQSLQDLLDKVKKDLDNRRQEQDNEKKEQSISKKQQRLATLRSNTSGGNQVEIAQLQQEIAEEQQEYERTLEDQLLDKLSEQADAAAKQRERQIELQEAVLQATNNAAEVNKWMNEPEKYQEEIRQAFYESKGYDTLTAAQQAQLEVEFNELFNGISTNQQNQQTIKTAIDLTAGQIGTLRTSLEGLAKIVADSAGNASIVEPEGSTIEVPDGATDPNPYKEEEDKSNADTESAGLDRANAVLKYQAKLLQAESNKKTSFNEIKSTVAIGHDAGLGTGTVLQDLAKTGGLTWKQILTALKGNYSKYRLALTYTSDAFKKAYDAVYGSGTYKKNRKVALDSKGKYTAYKFASGGIADYTGPAWLDGTPSKPELVLNAQDTKNFLALRDILGSTMGAIDSTNNSVGDISYEININVDHINNDYDVDKIAARIKKDIVKDASYRNVTQARKFR